MISPPQKSTPSPMAVYDQEYGQEYGDNLCVQITESQSRGEARQRKRRWQSQTSQNREQQHS